MSSRWPYHLGPWRPGVGWAVVGPSGLHIAYYRTRREALDFARECRERAQAKRSSLAKPAYEQVTDGDL